MYKTYYPKLAEISQKWYVVDAEGKALGRLSSQVASILRGKNKTYYSPHMDTGDFVIVVNAAKIRMTGRKALNKKYFSHSGYMGGGRFESYGEAIAKHPEEIISRAVKGMLPRNTLGRKLFRKLKVYAGPEHPHQAQQPEALEIEG
jgi:large subunit ribosomal protein L13